MKIDRVIIGIVGIITMEVVALMNGINGVSLSLSIAAISGLCGYTLRDIVLKRGIPPHTPNE